MHSVTDINTLGTTYKIVNRDGDEMKQVRVIWMDELLSAAVGEYNEDDFRGFDDYLEQSVSRLENFGKEWQLSWYTATEQEFDLHDAMQMVVDEGNDYIVVEIIPAKLGLSIDI